MQPKIIHNPNTGEEMILSNGQWQPYNEDDFQRWYGTVSREIGLDTDPDDPEHKYDYRSAYASGFNPLESKDLHWPSEFKAPDHPDRYKIHNDYVEDTINGQQAKIIENSETNETRYFNEGTNKWESFEFPKIEFGKTIVEGAKDVFRNAVNFLKEADANSWRTIYGDNVEAAKARHDEEVRKDVLMQQVDAQWLKPDGTLKRPEGMKGYVQDIFRMIPQMGTQIGVTAVGGPIAGGTFMGTQIAGGDVQELKEEGVDPERAWKAALADAFMQAPLEQIGISKALKWWKPSKKAMSAIKSFVGGGTKEFLTEWAQKNPELAAKIWAVSEGKTTDEMLDDFTEGFWEAQKEGLYEGFVAAPFGAFGGAGGALFRKGQNTINKEDILNDLVENKIRTDELNEFKKTVSSENATIIDEAISDFEQGRPNAPGIKTGPIQEVETGKGIFPQQTAEEQAAMEQDIRQQRAAKPEQFREPTREPKQVFPYPPQQAAQQQINDEWSEYEAAERAVTEARLKLARRQYGVEPKTGYVPGQEVNLAQQAKELNIAQPPTTQALPEGQGFELKGTPYTPGQLPAKPIEMPYQKEQGEPQKAEKREPEKPMGEVAEEVSSEKAEEIKSFRTAKGSAYTVNEDGTTTRDKAPRPEHPGKHERGIQPKSKKTWYVTEKDIDKLSIIQTRGGDKIGIGGFTDGRIAAKYITGENKGKFIKNTIVSPSTTPKKGLYPVEYWGDDRTIHFGNKIVEIEKTLTKQSTDDLSQITTGTSVRYKRGKYNVEEIENGRAIISNTRGEKVVNLSELSVWSKRLPRQAPTEKRAIGKAWIGNQQRPIIDAYEFKRGRNKGNYRVTLPDGSKKIVERDGVKFEEQKPSKQIKSITKTLKDETGSSQLADDILRKAADLIQNGVDNFGRFRREMQKAFKDIWDRIKQHIKALWDIVSNQRGEITIGKKPTEGMTKERRAELMKRYTKASKPKESDEILDKTYNTTQQAKNSINGKEQKQDEYEIAKDTWFGTKDTRLLENSVEAKKLQDEIKNAINEKRYGQKVRDIDKAIQIYIDLKRNPEHREKFYSKLNAYQKKIVDLADSLPDGIKQIADKISKSYESIGIEALEADVIKNVLDNYAGRVWDYKGGTKERARKFGTTTRHAKQRKFETILEGWASGLELKVEGATNNLNVLKDEIIKTIEDKRFIKTLGKLTDVDGDSIITTKQLEGYNKVEHPNFVKWEPVGKAEEKATGEIKWYGKNSFVDEKGNVWERKALYAPEKIAKNLNNILGTSALNKIPGVHIVTKYNAIFKNWILQSSFFHHLAFMRSYYLGTNHKKWREMNIRKAYKEGYDSILKMDSIVKIGVKNGLTLGVKQDWSESLLQEKTAIGNILDKLKASRAIKNKILLLRDMQGDFLFNKFGAGLKAKSFAVEYRNQLKKYPNQNPDVIAKRVANLINDDFGGLHLGRLGRNPTTQHIFRIFALAPDWTESNIRTMVKSIKSGTKEETALYRKFWTGVIVKGIAATALANFMMAGGDSEDWYKKYRKAWKEGKFRWLMINITPIYKFFGGSSGEDKYFSLLGHFTDPAKFIMHPIRSAHHKGSVVYKTMHEALTGTNWAGQKFTTLNELWENKKTVKFGPASPLSYEQFPSYIISQIIGAQPVQIQNLIKWELGEMEGFDTITNSMGLGVKTTYSDKRKVKFKKLSDDTITELEQLGFVVHNPKQVLKQRGKEYQLNEEKYNQYKKIFQDQLEIDIIRLINGNTWKNATDIQKLRKLRSIRRRTGSIIKKRMLINLTAKK